jgi:hypothetical protein
MQQAVATNSASEVTKSAPPKIPPEIRALLGPPPLLISEDPAAYEALLATFGAKMRPTDEIEWIYLKDCVDLTWEIQRYRRAKAGIIGEWSRQDSNRLPHREPVIQSREVRFIGMFNEHLHHLPERRPADPRGHNQWIDLAKQAQFLADQPAISTRAR